MLYYLLVFISMHIVKCNTILSSSNWFFLSRIDLTCFVQWICKEFATVQEIEGENKTCKRKYKKIMIANNAEKFQVCREIGWGDFEGATNNGKSDIQYLIYLFMAEIETIRENKGIINI